MFIPQHLKFIIFHRSLSVITISNSNEGRKLRFLLRLPLSLHIILLLSPSIPVQINARRGAEEPLLVAVGFLSDLCMKHHNDHVSSFFQISSHCISGQSLAASKASVQRIWMLWSQSERHFHNIFKQRPIRISPSFFWSHNCRQNNIELEQSTFFIPCLHFQSQRKQVETGG